MQRKVNGKPRSQQSQGVEGRRLIGGGCLRKSLPRPHRLPWSTNTFGMPLFIFSARLNVLERDWVSVLFFRNPKGHMLI